jgi:aminoglycoside N3'-acetyltransferase
LLTSTSRSAADDYRIHQASLQKALEPYAGKPVMVHSDLFRASPFVPRTVDRARTLVSHRDLLRSLDCRLRVVAFNYQFTRDRATDLRTAPVEVGPLGNFMRENWAADRTFDPVFSFLTDEKTDGAPPEPGLFIAFAERSLFPHIPSEGGAILMYGADVTSLTMLHLAELQEGGPLYRYDKDFEGTVTDWHGRAVRIRYRYHVRPLGRRLVYDWVGIQNLLENSGVLCWIDNHRHSLGFVLDGRSLLDTLITALRDDPLCLLDSESRAWVAPEIQRLGRRFVIGDFEPVSGS